MAANFLVAITAGFRVLYVFVVMEVGSRRILHCNVTAHPTAGWTLQQFREAKPFPVIMGIAFSSMIVTRSSRQKLTNTRRNHLTQSHRVTVPENTVHLDRWLARDLPVLGGNENRSSRHLRALQHRVAEALAYTDAPVVVDAVVDPFALSLPSHVPFHTAKGYTLSLAKQVLSGRMDSVIQTIERNIRLV